MTMTRNVGTIDRIARVVLGLVFLAYALGYIAPDTGYNAWGWLGLFLIGTAAVSFCPIYRVFGMRTCQD